MRKEQLTHVHREHALVVLAEHAVIEASLGEFAVQEPKPKQIVAELFAEEALAANTVECDEHTGFEQFLGRDARAALPWSRVRQKAVKVA